MKKFGTNRSGTFVRRLLIVGGGLAFTLALFLILPFLQVIAGGGLKKSLFESVDVALQPPPPPPPEPPPPEEEKEEEPPKLEAEPEPLDLSQLEAALNPGGAGDGWGSMGMNSLADALNRAKGDLDQVFSSSELDQKPRLVYQVNPKYPSELAKKEVAGRVTVMMVVDQEGRVMNPRIENSTDPAFDSAVLAAVRQWRYEPALKDGVKVAARVRVPISFGRQ